MNIDLCVVYCDVCIVLNDCVWKMFGLGFKIVGFGVGYCYLMYSVLKLFDRKVIGLEDVMFWLMYFMIVFMFVIGEVIGVVGWCV